ncbi:hypothetical protein FOZ62_025302 [Perkinsus olseni]|uniref:Uncharacterized protein n=1 Tax=Perkinsus olseni TaxID=32597 RepID=A0A7J6SZU0_PEROL|nr:hypothetical protein FOZ62_025302 [Perkinsus olseni]
MISTVSTWLLAVPALVTFASAQDVGKFVHQAPDFKATYDVNEQHEVSVTFTVKGGPKYTIIEGEAVLRSVVDDEYTLGPHKLVGTPKPSTYAMDNQNLLSLDVIAAPLQRALIDYGVGDGFGTIKPSDMTELTYTSADTFTTTLGSRRLLFTRDAYDLVEGDFVYKDPIAPHHEMTYTIRDDGILGIRVKCGKHRASSGPLKLVPRYHDKRRIRYEVESTGRGNLYTFLHQARQICPSKFSTPNALSQVVFATEKTIFVPFEGGTLALTKV